jgi:type I protein arginine methyltransferase
MTNSEETLLGQFIPLHYHYQMLLDKARMTGFKEAIQYVVQPGHKVVELGGGTGVLSCYASQKAAHVWCVERNPQMVEASRRFLSLNGCSGKVEVIEANAMEYLPPEPVDAVICEMLHSALLREKQIEVLDTFKRNYTARFGPKLPVFIPEATILAVQPVEQNFDFYGYKAPVPMFTEPTLPHSDITQLADPTIYSMFEYKKPLSFEYGFDGQLTIATPGTLNALRFITKNVLAILLEKQATIDWHNFYLILPVPEPIQVASGDQIKVGFSYQAGAPLEALLNELRVAKA